MTGFIIGTLCLLALIWVIRRGRRARWGYGYRRMRGPGRFYLHWLFRRLDTMPGQEKEIRSALEDFAAQTDDLKQELGRARLDVATALKGDDFDEALTSEVFTRQSTTLDRLRESAVASLSRIHEALDDRQRARLAKIIETGPGGRCGPWGWARA